MPLPAAVRDQAWYSAEYAISEAGAVAILIRQTPSGSVRFVVVYVRRCVLCAQRRHGRVAVVVYV